MFQELDIDLPGFQRVDAQVAGDRGLKSSRQNVCTALSSLLDQAEVHRTKSIGRIPSTVRIPGRVSEVEERLLPFVRDPVGTALRLGIRRLGEIAAGFMTIDQMTDVVEKAAAECGDQGVREVIVDKAWDGLRDKVGSYWIA
jgi:hypothetical protein